jgi:hypothetical protein
MARSRSSRGHGARGTVRRDPGRDVEIITWLDDHSRYALRCSAHTRVTAKIVLATFRQSAATYGIPASTLTDNGMVYTVRLVTGRGGRTALDAELARLGTIGHICWR